LIVAYNKIFKLLKDEIIATNYNTDNKGYKTCHGFCKPFLLSREYSIRGQHLDRAAALNQNLIPGQLTGHFGTLYRDTRKTQETFNWTAKTAPCFAHSGWYQDSTPRQLFCSSLHSCLPAGKRSATLTTFIAGPLGHILEITTNINKS